MEFNGINNPNIKTGEIHSPNLDVPAPEKEQTENKKENCAKTPNDPSYWQHARGVSFRGANKQDVEDVRKKMYEIIDERCFSPSENQHAKEFADLWLELCPDTLSAQYPAKRIIPFLSYPKFDFEKNKNLLTAVLSNESYSTDEKTEYLYTMVYQKLDPNEEKSKDTVQNEMDTYFRFKKAWGDDDDAMSLIEDFDLTIEQVGTVLDLIQSHRLDTEDFKDFFYLPRSRDLYDQSKSISQILASLKSHTEDENDSLFEYFKNLISEDIAVCALKYDTISELIEENSPIKKQVAASLCKLSRGQLQPAVFDAEGLNEIFNSINEDNIKDFETAIIQNGQVADDFTGHKYVNPKTGLFDINMQNYEKELEEKRLKMPDDIVLMPANVYPIVRESIDMKTGEISPVAKKFTDGYCFHKEPLSLKTIGRKIKCGLKQNSVKSPLRTQDDFENQIYILISALKDSEGGFSENNLNFMENLMNRSLPWALSVKRSAEEVRDFFNATKDENGEVSKELFDFGLDVAGKTESFDCAINVLEAYKAKNSDSAKFILNSLQDIYNSIGCNDEELIYRNFVPVANACFDENGVCNQERMVFAADLLRACPSLYLDEKILTLGEDGEQRDFILDIVNNRNSNSQTVKQLGALYSRYGGDELGAKPDSFILSKLSEYAKTGTYIWFFQNIFDECSAGDDEHEDFDNETYEKIIALLNASPNLINTEAVRSSIVPLVRDGRLPENSSFKYRTAILNAFLKVAQRMETGAIKQNKFSKDFVDRVIVDIDRSLSMSDISVPADKEDIKTFVADCIGNTKPEENGLTRFENVIKKSIPLMENMKTGLKISYSREEFLSDLNALIDDEEKISILSDKTGANFCADGNELTGWDGIIAIDELDRNDKFQNRVYEICHKFLYENKSISGNIEFDNEINKILKACPEFFNTIGKKQHGTHEYSLDIHQLLVLAYSIDNPDYEKLNPVDKTMLKTACIFHDIAKQEGVVDKGHQDPSAIYTRSIIKKLFKNPEQRDRVYELVKNHHWLEQYSTGKKSAEETAYSFRRPNDFEIAKIMAKSDLMAVSGGFYERFKDNLAPDKIAPVEKNLNSLYASGCAVFPSKIVDFDKFKANKETKGGIEYNVINFNKIKDNEDMGKYGFEPGLQKSDVKFLVHMVNGSSMKADLRTVKMLTSPTNGGVLSESLITPKYRRTYQDRKYGVLLSQINPNVINVAPGNQGSGRAKEAKDIMNFVFGYERLTRENFKSGLIENLGIGADSVTDDEYAEFYKNNLALKTSLSEIVDTKEYMLGGKTFTGADLKKAISDYQDSIIDKKEDRHNEIVGYIPKVQAVIAKAKNLQEVPADLLDFAHENELPIVLI